MKESHAYHVLPPRVTRWPVYSFQQVRTAAAMHNIKARLYLFDDGQTIELTDATGRQIARITALWGDDYTAPEMAAKWLMEHTTTTVFDFVGK